ncbi:MAG: GlsB/YeaQ/YmgE family stress response membrane protein [Anaerolineales bacterium]
MGIFATLVVGLIAGWLASLVMKTKTSIWMDLLMGIIGGFVGGWLSSLLLGGNLMSGINITSIVVALIGAIVVIAIYRLVTRRR